MKLFSRYQKKYGKKYQGVVKMETNTKKHSVSTIRDLMIKVEKGSGEYRKIIASRRVFFSVITMFFFLKFRSQR